jgi:uncharacterized protein YceK
MRSFSLWLLVGLVVLLSGCSTTPYDKATIYYDRVQFPAQIVKDYPTLSDSILQHGRCSLIISTPGSNIGTYYFCTYALTADGLYVQGWDAKALKYVEIVHVDLSTLKKNLHLFILADQSASVDAGATSDGTERLH